MNTTSPAPNPSASLSNRDLLRWMFGFLKPVKGMAVLCCVYLAVAVGLEVLAVRQTGQAINRIEKLQVSDAVTHDPFRGWVASADPEAVDLRRVILVLVCLTVGILVLRFVREVQNTKFSMQMVYYIREAVYDKLQRVGFKFHDRVPSGQLINRALTDLQNVRAFVQTALLTTLEIVLIVGGYIILVLTRSPWVAVLALVPIPIWIAYILWFGRYMQPASKAVMEAGDRNVSLITENIAGVHVVKAFATEPIEIAKYNRNCDDYFARVMRAARLWSWFSPVIRGIGAASHLSLFLAAGVLMIRGKLQVGDFLILGTAMGAILGRLQQVATINEQYQNAIVSARRLHEVLMAPSGVVEKPGAPALPPGPGTVKFENVTFGYEPNKPVLHDVSFEVPGGKVVAIVGPTGAGKTTLVNLLARFYDPQRGRVLIDGVDVREASLASIRMQVGFVFQETNLFSDTVEANIAYGRPGVKGGEVESAARLAQAHDFIEALPHGYKTMLGERGTSLSGGQKQRLAIARAILFDPRVLVLDDATAAVDPETEDLIRRGMGLVLHGRTVFVIAHRISTVKRAGVVLVVEDGRITQIGTHAQLMQQDGHYRDIAAVQLYGDHVKRDAEGDLPSHMDRMKEPKVETKPAAVVEAKPEATATPSATSPG
ncbi:MAG: ABC transporter ATP-binding protein, partial [Tepidisphaeraceae bacterium]